MTRKLMLASAIATALAGHPALALELGALRTDSALNQPFQGEIDLGDIEPGALDALRVAIASAEAFKKAGIERYHYLTQLRFAPEVTADGRMRIRVTSQEPVREPYLDFLVEAVWPAGRLVKGYTVLLDPPAQTERRAPNVQAARVRTAASGPDRGLPPVSSGSGTYIAAPGDGFPLYIGPVGGGEGLWSLARRHAAAGATDAQTAMALYRCNQGAFVRGDINRLIAGKTLVIPSRAELFALEAGDARRELQAALKGRPARRAPLTDVTPETLSRLRLVGAASTPGAPAAVPAPAPQPRATAAGVQSPDVLLAIETSETARQETIELRNRIKELETQLADIQALLQVRNAELARAQTAESDTADIPTGLEPIAVPDSAADEAVSQPAETPLPIADESVALQDRTGETAAIREPDRESEPEAAAEREPVLPPQEPGATIGLVPVPTPLPVESEATADVAPPAPAVAPPAVKEPSPAVVPQESAAPAEEPPSASDSPSTWHSLLLPLAGLAGVTALGILLFSLLTARRRRQAQADDEADLASELVLDPFDRSTAIEPEPSPAPRAAAPLETVSLAKTGSARQSAVPAPAAPEHADTDGDVLSGLTDFDAETDEADVLSEADIYIAYGRHREARDLLHKELKRYPQRLDIRYKLAEALAAAGEAEALRDLLDTIRSSGGDTEEPAQWERMQRLLRELAPNAPLAPAAPSLTPSAVAAASAGLGLAGAAALSEALESVAVPALESTAAPGDESEDDLLLDLGDSGPLAFEDIQGMMSSDGGLPGDEPPVPAIEDITQAIEGDLDSILPLPEDAVELDLDLGVFDGTSAPIAAQSVPVAAAADDVGLEIPQLDEHLGDLDLTIDDLGGREEAPPIRLEPPLPVEPPSLDVATETQGALETSLTPEQESMPTDLLSSQWQIDSGIWDETATKLDLARAYVEMDDRDAAREILEEVIAEGREEQRREARAMLERLG